jgi:CO/xanthine dehydrogenase FAD-binding subunit
MPHLEILRPGTLQEALRLLPEAEPLAGGTWITPRRHQARRLMDLRDLGLDGIQVREGVLIVGATATLQALLERAPGLPPAMREALKLEAGWNLRNMATLGGLALTHDGRSPLLTVLLAMEARLRWEPGGQVTPLDAFDRREEGGPRLLTALEVPIPSALAYHSVARAPADFPLVCAAAARFERQGGAGGLRLALGGWGERPRLVVADAPLDSPLEALVRQAGEAYRAASDAYASAEYRGAVAQVLARRALAEVLA